MLVDGEGRHPTQDPGSTSPKEKLELLGETADQLRDRLREPGVLMTPGGYFRVRGRPPKPSGEFLSELKAVTSDNLTLVIGLDGDDPRPGTHQLALAIDHNQGVRAAGRKFYPSRGEMDIVERATSPYEGEWGLPRILEVAGSRFFLASCYDIFGVKGIPRPDPSVDAILDLIHGFSPHGEPGSGEVLYARHGLGGASQAWGCAAFGAVFFERRPSNPGFPSGVRNIKPGTTRHWKYSDNVIQSDEAVTPQTERLSAYVKVFKEW
jgi:hypothetical protein